MSKRSRISDMQREILGGFYRRGMVGTGSLYKEMVEKAASDTELTKTQVEVRNPLIQCLLHSQYFLPKFDSTPIAIN